MTYVRNMIPYSSSGVDKKVLTLDRLSGHSEYSAPRARPQQRQPEATVSEMSHLEELVLRSSTASAATLPHLRKVTFSQFQIS